MKHNNPQEIFSGLTRSIFVDSLREQINRRYNVSDSVINSVNYNDIVKSNKTETEVNLLADKLAKQLNNPSGRLFYCKVGWKLSEATINRNLELALKGNSPARYFTWLCKRDLKNSV